MTDNARGSQLPDAYDRTLANLDGLPDVIHTSPSTLRAVPTLGIGGIGTYVVQTYRRQGEGDTLFLEVIDADGLKRLVIPPKVTELIARQREALTARSRSRTAKRVAADRKARGLQPGFMTKGRRTKPAKAG